VRRVGTVLSGRDDQPPDRHSCSPEDSDGLFRRPIKEGFDLCLVVNDDNHLKGLPILGDCRTCGADGGCRCEGEDESASASVHALRSGSSWCART
jgi:hypothetical protein